MLDTAATWALVDDIAVKVAWRVLSQREDEAVVLARWATHANFWLRRSCLLAHLEQLRGGGGDFQRFAAFAIPMLSEKEFFIRKVCSFLTCDARADGVSRQSAGCCETRLASSQRRCMRLCWSTRRACPQSRTEKRSRNSRQHRRARLRHFANKHFATVQPVRPANTVRN